MASGYHSGQHSCRDSEKNIRIDIQGLGSDRLGRHILALPFISWVSFGKSLTLLRLSLAVKGVNDFDTGEYWEH